MSNNKAKVLAFYSYKGGTGRTTASANVSALLAKRGHRVLCLDLDLEGPGIGIVFSLPESEHSPFPLQDYFEGKKVLKREDFIAYEKIQTPEKGGLWILPASSRLAGTVDTTRGGRLLAQLRRLIDLAKEELEIDVIIIDTPSGFGDLSALSMYVSDCVVALFRYSRQHILGTAKVVEFVNKNELMYFLVASCVPSEDFGEKAKYQSMLDTFSHESTVEIREDNNLKWRERVIVDQNVDSFPALAGYELLADQLAGVIDDAEDVS